MKILFIALALALAILSFFQVYKKSKYNRLSNLSNLILIIILGVYLMFVPIKNPTLDYSSSDKSLTVSDSGYIYISDIGGESTENFSVKLDVDKEYINVLLSDGIDSVPYSTFTFTEASGITYDLDYDGTNDEFYLFRNFSIASGFNVIALVAITLILMNLVLMVSRMLREKEVNPHETKYKITTLQRIINILERASLIAIGGIFVFYLIFIFVDYPLQIIYYLKDTQYILLVFALMLSPIILSFFRELTRKEYAYWVNEDTIQVYSGSQLVFEAQGDSFDLKETLIRNSRSIGKDYLQMSATLIDETQKYEGLNIDLKPLGSAQAFKLLDSLRSINMLGEKIDSKPSDDYNVKVEDNHVLTGKLARKSDTRNTVILIVVFAVLFLILSINSYKISEMFGPMIAIALIILMSILPIVLVIVYQVRLNNNMGIINVKFQDNFISFNDKQYEINEHLIIEMTYPDSVAARYAKINVKSYGTLNVYTIKRNHKIPQDAYYDLYTVISHKYPNILKVR